MIRYDQDGRGQLVEIDVSHQIRWNILREHNWGVPQLILSLYTMIHMLYNI